MRRLAREGLLGRNGVGMLLAEPTSGVIWNANRGAISLRVQVFGKSAHVGLQHQGGECVRTPASHRRAASKR